MSEYDYAIYVLNEVLKNRKQNLREWEATDGPRDEMESEIIKLKSAIKRLKEE